MEVELAKELMQYFFHAPGANGILVYEDNDYLGIVLKRDIEIGIMEGNFNLFENINFVRLNQITGVLFKNENIKNAQIPVIDKTGKLIRIISQEEFQCHFYFDEYIGHFKEQLVLDNLEHPFIMTSHFKKTIYANKAALELFEKDIIGKSFNLILKLYQIKIKDNLMVLEKNENTYNLIISHSCTPQFSCFIYQLFKL